MSLATRRRAIYTGLAGHFAEDELLAVLALWENKYADKPPFALNEFLGEVAATCERKLERTKLYRELVGALTGPLSALLPDPEPQLLSWRQRMGVAAPLRVGTDSQARHTFEALSRVLFNALDAGLLPRLQHFVAGNLSNLSGSNVQRLRVRAWLEQGAELEPAGLGLEQLRQLLNLLYIGLCEYLGPVVADQRLTHAVQQVEALHLALAPRKLL
ncbi:hypothetical protein DBR00_07070 [Pseudomonas sp. HMWF032]|uniref:hypothetical protein n=1 Tax=Pseudomonas sp. HMWF032 TaxID=2056866 RepID=UPI000D33FEA4|nr:hypothetical protein [Pseudomonas sp. HMWF032]PTS85530.1 hypothetical protein DBR00_07070 [Pseudomonas sp. HMWF032]PTT85716.1 hypothetical protein DBR41_02910 [Pseudomonas sp. HMWF010]